MDQQLPCSMWAEPHLRHLDLEWTPVLRVTGMVRKYLPQGTWALPSQWVNPVQHEGSARAFSFHALPAHGIIRCWPDTEHGSTNVLEAQSDTGQSTLGPCSHHR